MMRTIVFILFAAMSVSVFAGGLKLIAWQTARGFAKDTTVEAVRFAETNGFDCVKLLVDGKTDLAPLLKAVGDRMDVWIEFKEYSSAFATRVADEIGKAGLPPNRVILASGTRWVVKELKTRFAQYRRVFPCRVDYYCPNYHWGVFCGPHGPIKCWTVDSIAEELAKFSAANGLWGVRLASERFITEPAVVKALQAKGVKVIVDDVNDPVTGDYYRQAGVDALVTALPAYTRGGSWPKGEPKRVKYIGHRGGEDYFAPEHSLAMAKLAAQKRLDIVKLDIHWTKDGEIVTHHDHTLKHVFGVDKMIKEHDYAELSAYEAIPVNCISNQHLATLAQILDVVKKDVGEFWIDFKDFTPACAEKTMKIVDAAGIVRSRVMVATYSEPALAYMRDHYPEIRRVMHISPWFDALGWHITYMSEIFADENAVIDEIARRQRRLGLFGVNLPGGYKSFGSDFRMSHEVMARLKKLGLWIAIYFPCDPITADYYRRAGVDAFVTGSARACEVRGK